MLIFRISVTMMSRLILNLNSYGDRHARRSLVRPNAAVGLQPSTQFTTHVTKYSSWIERTAQEFETEFESEASTGLTFSAGSGPTDEVLSDEEYAPHGNDIEMDRQKQKVETDTKRRYVSSHRNLVFEGLELAASSRTSLKCSCIH